MDMFVSKINFYNLALFICNLFIDGEFRTNCLLYDTNVFDDNLMSQITTVCPNQIPWLINDINSYRRIYDETAYQLILFDPKKLTMQMEQCERYFPYYRIFMFFSIDEIEMEVQYSIIKNYSPGYSSSTLILYYDTTNGKIFINWTPINDFDPGTWRPVELIPVNVGNLYEKTFGEHERQRKIGINFIWNMGYTIAKSFEMARVNYFHLRLPTSFINISWIRYLGDLHPYRNEMCEITSNDKYKELSEDYDCYDGAKL